MLEFLNILIFAVLAMGIAVILSVILFATYLGIMDSDLCRRFRLWRKERMINKFMEDLKK